VPAKLFLIDRHTGARLAPSVAGENGLCYRRRDALLTRFRAGANRRPRGRSWGEIGSGRGATLTTLTMQDPKSLMRRFGKYSRTRRRAQIGGESGYALLLAIFLVATLLLVTAVATPNVLTQGRRQKEEEMIWRGNQYIRGVRLFFRKNGRYPQSLEQLTTVGADNVHFLRKAYAEPMNTGDGSWRLIYVSPSGQLIGSVHYRTLQEMAVAFAMAGQLGGGASGVAAQLFGQPTAMAPSQSQSNQGISSSAQPTAVGNLQAVDGPVFGGSVIGVASKVKKASVRVYQGGTTYFEWEFIWNPLLGGNLGQIPGVPVGPTPVAPPGTPVAPPGVPLPNPMSPTAPGTPLPTPTTLQ